MKVPYGAGRGGDGKFRASVHLGITCRRKGGDGECPSVLPAGGRTGAMTRGAQPNMRLELAPPVVVELQL